LGGRSDDNPVLPAGMLDVPPQPHVYATDGRLRNMA